MQFWTVLWHIRQLTDQPIALGGIGLSRILPIIVFSLIGGAVADSFNRQRVMLITQFSFVILALLLGLLTMQGRISIWSIYAITALQATGFAFDLPSRQALVPNLVPATDLPNAISMVSISFTVGSIVGPGLSGLVIAFFGLEFVYFINAVSFIAVILAVILMGHVEHDNTRTKSAGVSLYAIRSGIQFLIKQPMILSTMLLDFIATFFSSARALLPIFTVDILGLGEVAYGLLSASEAIGSAIAGIIVSQIKQIRHQGKILLGAIVVYGAATVLFGFSRNLGLSMLTLMVIGSSDTVSTIIRNTIRHLQTPDHLRGRMTSINQIFFMGGPQFGELEAGLAAQFFGAPVAVISGGLLCILGVGWVANRWPQIQRYNGDEWELANTMKH